jgi:hypothetical protein
MDTTLAHAPTHAGFIHLLTVSHAVGALVALCTVVSLAKVMSGGRRRPLRVPQPQRPAHRRQLIGRACRCVVVAVVWVPIYPIGWLVANRRYPVVAPVLRTLEEDAAACHHRLGHLLCFPFLLWPQWIVRCAGCGAYIHAREVLSVRGDGVDLKIVRSTLTGRCPARYLVAPPGSSTPPATVLAPTLEAAAPAQPLDTMDHKTA